MKAATYTTASPEETEALGAEFSRTLNSGARVGLIGELGSGKTRFTRGIASGLSATGRVKSPSFTIVNVYEGGRLPLYHIDLYRISGEAEFYDAGIEEYIYGTGISVIEWADMVPGLTDECAVVVRFSHDGEFRRVITISSAVETEKL